MKLLIITQVVDSEHPVLGFFHRWIEEFSKYYEQVHVICLQEGQHSLPSNVTVHSLGKEASARKLTYIWRFYRYCWKLRNSYDHVFVHMNQVYVILGGLLWHWQKKQIGLWYMHGKTSFSLKVAEILVDKVFTGSIESFRISSHKVLVTGHGIDTELFVPYAVDKEIDLITVGRIAPIKNLEKQIDVLEEVRKTYPATLTVVGVALTAVEKHYFERLGTYIKQKKLTPHVHFIGKVSQKNLPQLLNRARVFIHTAKNGSLDKAVLEAMSCGVAVVSTSDSLFDTPVGEVAADTTNIADRVTHLLTSKVTYDSVKSH